MGIFQLPFPHRFQKYPIYYYVVESDIPKMLWGSHLRIYPPPLTLKTNDWRNYSMLFFKYPSLPISSKMAQWSKRIFGCKVSKETSPYYGGFWFMEKSGKPHGAIILKHSKRLHHGFCLFFINKKLPWLGLVSFET